MSAGIRGFVLQRVGSGMFGGYFHPLNDFFLRNVNDVESMELRDRDKHGVPIGTDRIRPWSSTGWDDCRVVHFL